MSFDSDKIKNEKPDPVEEARSKYNFIPMTMYILIMIFGVLYLSLNTNVVSMWEGDSRTPPPVAEVSDEPIKIDKAYLMKKGAKVYAGTCQACHQASGAGIPGAFPPLAGSEWVHGPASEVAAVVMHGLQGEITVKGVKFNSVMPAQSQLDDEDIASVVTYVRNSFGNEGSIITPEEVVAVREKTKAHTAPFNGEKELKSIKWE